MATLKQKLDLFQFTQEGTLFLTINGWEIGYAQGPTDSAGMPKEPLITFYEHKNILEEIKLEVRDEALVEEISDLLDRKERWWHQLPTSVKKWLLTSDVVWRNGIAATEWFGPRPDCCVNIKTMMEDTLDHPRPFIYLQQHFDSGAPSCYSGPMFWWCGSRVIFHCPFCGYQLPKVELDPTPIGPIHHTTDGNRCDTCKERNHGCNCRPPTANYRLKEKVTNA